MNLAEEKILLEQAKTEPEAFGKIFDWYGPRILNYTLKRVGKVEIAQDVVSEVFLKAFQKIGSFRWQNVTIGAWLYRIALREIANVFRGRRVVSLEKLFEDEQFEIADQRSLHEEMIRVQDEIQANLDLVLLQKLLRQLPLKYQEVLTLKFFENKNSFEIAEILDKKDSTIRTLIARGLEKLRKEFEQSK